MRDDCPEEVLADAIHWMATLNREASAKAAQVGCRCATDITGFGLAGHCFNVARASGVAITINAAKLPLLDGIAELIHNGHTTGGAITTRAFLGERLRFKNADPIVESIVCDPQTSGGLTIFSRTPIDGYPCIGEVTDGEPSITVV
jgi:selenide,water dikinase